MIYRLRRKFILISTLSIESVLIVIFACILLFNTLSLNRTMDTLTDTISAGGGVIPDLTQREEGAPPPRGGERPDDLINKETQFSTRYFTVFYDADGKYLESVTDAIRSVDGAGARALADEVMAGRSTRGWSGEYRYKKYATESGTAVTFVDGSMNRHQSGRYLLGTMAVLAASGVVSLALIIIFSRRAVRPVAESYEKQKQFVTDANHELKTPLTLILTDLDIAEAELGKNEWLDDMRAEGKNMAALVEQLVTLSRMDEERHEMKKEVFSLSDCVADTVSEFAASALAKAKRLHAKVEENLTFEGDEGAFRRLCAILLDNAVKYCDEGGEITVNLAAKHKITLAVENTYAGVGDVPLDRLFDRFYRADKARTAGSGFGIGLSIAKSIARAHGGELTAYKKDEDRIGFLLSLPMPRGAKKN